MLIINTVLHKIFHRLEDPALRSVHIAQGLCLLLFLCCTVYLIDTDKPWELGIQKRLDAGKNLTIEQDVALGFFAASIVTAAVALAAYFLAPWWARPLPLLTRTQLKPAVESDIPLRTFWLLVIVAVCVAGVLRLPLASKSLWWDETWTLQRVVLGQWDQSDENPEQLEWDERSWKRAFFYYQKPTNHIAFSVSAKATTHLWQRLSGANEDEFNELAFRLPALLAALGSIVVIALFLRQLGFARAGVAGAFLLALHPWHIQYGIDGRAFSFVVLFSMLSVMQLMTAMQSLRWRNWLAFAGCQLTLIWSFPYAVFFSFLLFVAALASSFWVHRQPDLRTTCIYRLLTANFASGIMLCYLLFPLIPQLLKWADKIHGNTMLTEHFFRQLAANLISGMPWDGGVTRQWFGIATLDSLAPIQIYLIFFTVSTLLICGLFILIKRQPRFTLFHIVYVLAAPFALCVAYIDTHYFYTRYVIYALPALIIYCCVTIDRIGLLTPVRWQPFASTVTLTLAVVAAALLWAPRTGMLLERPVSPNREVARLMAELAAPDPQSQVTVGYNLGGRKPDAYYKHIRFAENLDDLRQYCSLARTNNVPLYVFFGYESFNRFDEPEPFRYFDDIDYFRKLWDFHGIEPDFHYQVFRYSGKEF